MLKQTLTPVAAFAVTATSASPFMGSEMVDRLNLNLTSEQTTALEEAHEIQEAARKEHREEVEAMRTAVENNDNDAFVTAIESSPLVDKITSKKSFEKFVKAQTLVKEGDFEAVRTLFVEL